MGTVTGCLCLLECLHTVELEQRPQVGDKVRCPKDDCQTELEVVRVITAEYRYRVVCQDCRFSTEWHNGMAAPVALGNGHQRKYKKHKVRMEKEKQL